MDENMMPVGEPKKKKKVWIIVVAVLLLIFFFAPVISSGKVPKTRAESYFCQTHGCGLLYFVTPYQFVKGWVGVNYFGE